MGRATEPGGTQSLWRPGGQNQAPQPSLHRETALKSLTVRSKEPSRAEFSAPHPTPFLS